MIDETGQLTWRGWFEGERKAVNEVARICDFPDIESLRWVVADVLDAAHRAGNTLDIVRAYHLAREVAGMKAIRGRKR